MSIRIKSRQRILAQMLRNKLKLNVELVEMSFLSNVGTRKVSCWLEAFTREGRWDANA